MYIILGLWRVYGVLVFIAGGLLVLTVGSLSHVLASKVSGATVLDLPPRRLGVGVFRLRAVKACLGSGFVCIPLQ